MTAENSNNNKIENENVVDRYRCLVIDSGPIIKHTGLSTLYGKAIEYYTVPGVIDEIRDSKARTHLQQLPMELQVKSPTQESIQQMIAFSKQTGDYVSLSKIDLEVLALTLDLEKDGCLLLEGGGGTTDHIRTSPKRIVGLGQIQSLKLPTEGKKSEEKQEQQEGNPEHKDEEKQQATTEKESNNNGSNEDETAPPTVVTENIIIDTDTARVVVEADEPAKEQVSAEAIAGPTHPTPTQQTGPKSWAMLVNPTSASKTVPKVEQGNVSTSQPAGSKVLSQDGGQFSDAEDDDDDDSPEEEQEKIGVNNVDENKLQAELEMDFPSLAAAATVPYEGSDDEGEDGDEDDSNNNKPSDAELLEKKKQEALKPISKSGKLYNPLRKYGNLTKPKPQPIKSKPTEEPPKEEDKTNDNANDDYDQKEQQSRIIGAGGGMVSSSEDMGWEEDDGEGWITCKRDIAGSTMGGRRNNNNDEEGNKGPTGPPKSARTACTTTDFAMQNVLLQIGLPLLSVDGVQIRKVKSWVYRCGACFKIHTDAEFNGMKRLFCSHCGSDMMQRVSASVDGKTGRLKLHLSKNYKHNLRGTKYSLPKPGTGNKYQGELLLREDQLLSGAWNQKVKIRTGGQSRANAQSMFGNDLASNVGCSTQLMSTDDVRVGFGRRNPNNAKGRERRGKKKKSSDRACGLRRY